MSSSDVRDVLNIPDGSGASGRPAKKQKLSASRPNLKGLAREVHMLGGDNPIAIVPEVTQFKKRRFASRKPAARWELRPFHNSARDHDNLILRHWRRADDRQHLQQHQQVHQPQPPAVQQESSGQAPESHPSDQDATPKEPENGEGDLAGGDASKEDQARASVEGEGQPSMQQTNIEDSAFAKFNVQVSVPQYTDEQYQQHLKSENWSREETDYLMDLARDFDLRWPLIWDRYEWHAPATNGDADADGDESKAVVPVTQIRTMEELKARYYEVASRIMAANRPVQFMSQSEFALHELMTHYNPQQEKLRKDFALNSLTRSREEAREEESLLLEIKRILARSERFNEERRELYARLDYPATETDISSFKSSAGLQTLLQNLMTVDKSKKRKSLLGPDGASPANPAAAAAAAAAAQAQTQETGRRDSTTASAAASNRDSGATSTPTGAGRKGQQQTPAERPKLTEKEEAIYGVTHHDRLGSGPTFRTEKINKLFSHKSNQQQLRINNTLNELDVPAKLAMPTSGTTLQYESLLGAVNNLLDARKVLDKLEGEVKLEMAKKAERDKANAPADPEKTEQKEGLDPAANVEDKAKEGEVVGAATETVTLEEPAKERDGDGAPQPANGAETNEDGKTQEVGDDDDEGEENAESQQPGEEDEEGGHAEEPTPEATNEDAADEKDKEKPARPGSSGAPHKRSASVMSAVSDKSAKRQKK